MIQLTAVIIALILLIVWLIKENHIQQKKLIKAIMSKNVQEFTQAEITEHPKKGFKPQEPDLTPLHELSDDAFMKIIKK